MYVTYQTFLNLDSENVIVYEFVLSMDSTKESEMSCEEMQALAESGSAD